MEDVATLIEGVLGSSSNDATLSTWTPSYSASGAMTFTSVVTNYAKYMYHGKLVWFSIRATGTTGGTASTDIYFTLPVTAAASNTIAFAGMALDTGSIGCAAYQQSTTLGAVRKYDATNWGLGASRVIVAQGFYEVA